MQMIECMVAIANDPLNIVHRDPSRPVTYPEMLLLQFLHGDEAVSDAYQVGNEDRDNSSELDRLRVTYGAIAVQAVFPGTKPRLPTQNSRIIARRAPTAPKRRPIPSRDNEPDEDELPPPATDMPEDDAPPDETPDDTGPGVPPVPYTPPAPLPLTPAARAARTRAALPAWPVAIEQGPGPGPGEDVDTLREGE